MNDEAALWDYNPSGGERPAVRRDFEGASITVEIFCGDETVEIAVESPHDPAA